VDILLCCVLLGHHNHAKNKKTLKIWLDMLMKCSDHEELAEGYVREDVVGFVLATCDATLLPEVGKLVEERTAGFQVQHILPG